MRKQFCDALVERAKQTDLVFLTGDLGFMALEQLQEALGSRFINAGVSEQNMVSVAAGLARQGMEVWVYSIAPFCYARPFEQIRNDICFHALPVKLVGNGGGYAYGVMGPTHHAIEDYGIMLALPGMTVRVPVFDQDVSAAVDGMGADPGPSYLRLGRGESLPGYAPPPLADWRQLTDGEGPVVIAVGPLAGLYLEAVCSLPEARRPRLWALARMPAPDIPQALLQQLSLAPGLIVAEEHVAQGGFASQLLLRLAELGATPRSFGHLHALAHQFERYGSQGYLRQQSRLDPASLIDAIAAVCP